MSDSHIERALTAVFTAITAIESLRQVSSSAREKTTTIGDTIKTARAAGIDATNLASMAGFSQAIHATWRTYCHSARSCMSTGTTTTEKHKNTNS